MTVGELIAFLEGYDKGTVVTLADWGENYRLPIELHTEDISIYDGKVLLGSDKSLK